MLLSLEPRTVRGPRIVYRQRALDLRVDSAHGAGSAVTSNSDRVAWGANARANSRAPAAMAIGIPPASTGGRPETAPTTSHARNQATNNQRSQARCVITAAGNGLAGGGTLIGAVEGR